MAATKNATEKPCGYVLSGTVILLILSLNTCGLFVIYNVSFNFHQEMLYNQSDNIKSLLPSTDIKLKPKILPTVIPPQEWERYPHDSWKGYQLPIMTAHPQGGMGNVLMEYATLYALNRIYNVSSVVHPKMAITLKYFDKISLPYMPGPYKASDWTPLYHLEGRELNYAMLHLAASGLLGPHRFISQRNPCEIRLFDLLRDKIRQEFKWNKSIRNMVQQFMIKQRVSLKERGILNPVFISLHIRRGDYIQFIKKFGGPLPNRIYFSRAIDYYKNKYSDAHFIVSSNDRNYFNRELKSYTEYFTLTPGLKPEVDMAILNACNHSIISVGSYSFWTGYLTGGEVLYPNISYKVTDYYFQRTYYEGIGLYFQPISVKE